MNTSKANLFGPDSNTTKICSECYVSLQGYGYNLDWRGWGTSEYCFTSNTPYRTLISNLHRTGEGILTASKHNTLGPVNIPSPVEIRDQ